MEELAIDKRKGLSIKKSFLVLIFYFILQDIFQLFTEVIFSFFRFIGIETGGLGFYRMLVAQIIAYSIVINRYKYLLINKLRVSNTIKINRYIFVCVVVISYKLIYDNTLSLIIDKLITNSSYYDIIQSALKFPIALNIAAIIVAPIFEEILCRGIILEGLLLRNKPYISIIISSLIFSIMHCNLVQIPNAFFIGLVLGIIYYKTKSLLPCIFAHFINNFFVTIVYYNPGLYNDDKFSIVKLSIGIILFVGSIWVVRNKLNTTN